MAVLSEIVVDGRERLVETAEPVEVGDALVVDDEILLVLRESPYASARARARFECRRALGLRNRATELIAHANELQLKLTKAREVRQRDAR